MGIIDDRVTLLESAAHALASGNLSMKEGRCDLDYIVALGEASANIKGAADLVRLRLTATPEAYDGARKAALSIARKLNTKRGWNFLNQDLAKVARSALHYYLSPVCPECEGRKFLAVPGTPMLSGRICPKCQGTGKRRIPITNGREIAEIVASLQRIEKVVEDGMRKRLAK